MSRPVTVLDPTVVRHTLFDAAVAQATGIALGRSIALDGSPGVRALAAHSGHPRRGAGRRLDGARARHAGACAESAARRRASTMSTARTAL